MKNKSLTDDLNRIMFAVAIVTGALFAYLLTIDLIDASQEFEGLGTAIMGLVLEFLFAVALIVIRTVGGRQMR